MKSITIYTKGYCPFCIQLKRFLNRSKVLFTEVEVSDKAELHREIISKTGHHTVPAVFIDEEFIGGSEEFYEWFSKNS